MCGKVHGSMGNRDPVPGNVGFCAGPLASFQGIAGQPLKDGPRGARLASVEQRFADLGQDLGLTEHQRIEPTGNPKQMPYRIVADVGVRRLFEQAGRDAVVAGEEPKNLATGIATVSVYGVDLGAIAGRENHSLAKVGVKLAQSVSQGIPRKGEPFTNGYRRIFMIRTNNHYLGNRQSDRPQSASSQWTANKVQQDCPHRG
jgi:hypothetical protein